MRWSRQGWGRAAIGAGPGSERNGGAWRQADREAPRVRTTAATAAEAHGRAAAVEGTESLLRRTLGETIDVKTRVESDLSEVLVDQSQLQNAMLNLALNARDAMPRGGRLTISASDAGIDVDYARMNTGFPRVGMS